MKETLVRRYLIPILAFVLGSSIIAGVYFGILTWAQGWESALQIFLPNRAYIIPIWISFGAQAALYSILRFRLFLPVSSSGYSGAWMGTSGGTSVTAMVACCLHHVTDVLPILGVSAAATIVAPGESKTFTFKALNAGLFVYHCAFGNPGLHMTHGMYGLILVEPEGGLPPVDKEFYVVQGEFYSEGDLVTPPPQGLQTTLIPAGGAAMVEFKVEYPGKFVIVDHALARVGRGAWGALHVEGEADPSIYEGEIEMGHGH